MINLINNKKMDILGGLAGLGQGLLQRQTDRLNANRNFQQNKEMAKYQYSKDLEMWNRANEYNSPSSQMARYQSAGLNPNLIYGTGTASAGNTATSLPKYQAPTYQQNYSPIVDLPNTIGLYQDFQMKQAQIDNLKEQGKILASESLMKEIDAYYYQNYAGSEIRGVGQSKARLAQSQADFRSQDIELLRKKIKNTQLANELRSKDVNWYIWNRLGASAVKSISEVAKRGVKTGLRGTTNIFKNYKFVK